MKTITLIALIASLAHAQKPAGEPEQPRWEPGTPFPPPGYEPQQRRPREVLTAFVGLVSRPASPEVRAQLKLGVGFGLVIDEVFPDSPAAAAGLRENDILVRLNDQRLVSPEQLQLLIIDAGKEKEVTFTFAREGTQQTASVKVAEKMMPERRPMQNFQGNPVRQPMGNERPSGRPEQDFPPGNQGPQNERITRKDADGRYELQRGPMPTFHVMDLEGNTIWKGPINGPELRNAVPEKYKPVLDAMDRDPGNRPRNPQPPQPFGPRPQ